MVQCQEYALSICHPTHPPTHRLNNRWVHADTLVCIWCTCSETPARTLALALSSLSLGSRWWGVVAPLSPLQATTPSTPVFPLHKHNPTPLCVVEEHESWKTKLQLAPPHTNPWLAAIGGTQSGVLMLQLGEETLVNLPIACHWPWSGLFVSGTPLISPPTSSSVLAPHSSDLIHSAPSVSSFLYDQPHFLFGYVSQRWLC